MDEAFDALLEFHKSAVVGDADHPAVDVRAHGITVLRIQPRIRRELLEAQRDPLLIFVVLQDLNLDVYKRQVWADVKGYKLPSGKKLKPGSEVTVHIDSDERSDISLHLDW